MVFSVVLVLIGAFAAAWSAIFIKLAGTHPVLLSSYRLLLAAAILSPRYLKDASRFNMPVGFSSFRPVLVPAVLMAAHFISWTVGARLTYVANSTLIVNMVPLAMPFFAFFLYRERLERTELIGTVLSLLGTFLLVGADFRISFDTFVGDMVSFVSMVFYTGYLACAKVKNRMPSVWLYVVPLYYAAGFICLAAALFVVPPWAEACTPQDAVAILGLAVVCTVVGHSIFNYGMKRLRGQLVSLLALTQALWAVVIAFLLFDENPTFAFFPASLCILGGIVIVVIGGGESRREPGGRS